MSFIVYKASAGSGKTFNLAKEYLKIVLQNPDDFKHILAITFTNKAANEMKTRIIDYLAGISSINPDGKGKKDLLPILVQESGLSENEIMLRSSIILRKILYRYADFSIMTIDSFFQKIIRSFSHDLNIPMNFKLEINLNDLVEQIVDNLIDLVGQDEGVGEILIQYINKLTGENKSWHIEKSLTDFSKEIFSESAYFNLKSLNEFDFNDFISAIKELKRGMVVIESELKTQSKKAIECITSKNIPLDAFSNKSKGIGFWLSNVSSGDYKLGAYALKAIYEDLWFPKHGYYPIFDTIKAEITEIGIFILKKIGELNDLKQIYSGIYALALVNQIKNGIQKIKDQEGLFFLSETNFVLSDVIRNQPTPFIYERIGEKYHHYFIDEFQDTSKLQWNNMIPLLIEAISSLHDGKEGSAILFGDAKQSIYRFRGGDFMQFVQLPKINLDGDEKFKTPIERILSGAYKPEFLESNFRTKPKIVEFNNELFEISKQFIPNHQHLYEGHTQLTNGNKSEGLVDVSLFEYSKDNQLFISETNNRVVSIITELKNAGYNYKDIAILGRDKKHLSNIASFLVSNKIQIISSDSLLLDASADVRFLINMIHFFKSGEDEIINASIVRYLVDVNKTLTLGENINACKTHHLMMDLFHNLGYQLDYNLCVKFNIYDLVEEIIRVFWSSKRADSYVLGFLDIIHKYHVDQQSESEFSNWWSEQKDNFSIAMPDGIDGVKLLTIHTAKGLEYPIVIIPNFQSKNHTAPIWVSTQDFDDEQLPYYKLPAARIQASTSDSISPEAQSCFLKEIKEEQQLKVVDEINISYVALTRPIDRLYIISQKPSDASLKKDTYSFSKLIDYYAQTHPEYKVHVENDDFSHYQIGLLSDKKPENHKINKENMISLNDFISTPWYSSMNLDYSEIDSEAIEWGTIFHFAMQYTHTFVDIDSAIQKTQLRFSLTNERANLLKSLVENTCNNKLISRYFSENYKIYNEKSIVDSQGKIHRPDRLLFENDKAIIIDFKTGRIKEYHEQQISEYKQLLIDIGFKSVQSFVVYVQSERVDVVEY